MSSSEYRYVLLGKQLRDRVVWLSVSEFGSVWLSSHTIRTQQICDVAGGPEPLCLTSATPRITVGAHVVNVRL